jgi:hypothetical protein
MELSVDPPCRLRGSSLSRHLFVCCWFNAVFYVIFTVLTNLLLAENVLNVWRLQVSTTGLHLWKVKEMTGKVFCEWYETITSIATMPDAPFILSLCFLLFG